MVSAGLGRVACCGFGRGRRRGAVGVRETPFVVDSGALGIGFGRDQATATASTVISFGVGFGRGGPCDDDGDRLASGICHDHQESNVPTTPSQPFDPSALSQTYVRG